MKKIIYVSLILLMIGLVSVFLFRGDNLRNGGQESVTADISNAPPMLPAPAEKDDKALDGQPSADSVPVEDIKKFQFPLDRARERAHKKPFGIFITPQNSPVQPEKFSGYHTAVDFEIFPEELNNDVLVKAVCTGKLLLKKSATGYGGVIVQACNLDGQPITVVYGHLNLDSIKVAMGGEVAVGDPLGTLGKAYSSQTSGERKHLHLGFHKGTAINILGDVPEKSSLSSWLDPLSVLR